MIIIDILVEGMYFLFLIFFVDLVYKSVVVNLSDLVVMGVKFIWMLFVFILFEIKEVWLVEFS